MNRGGVDRFSMNGEKRREQNYIYSVSHILYIYEDILQSKGIHEKPITEDSFNTIYARYQSLGGQRLFHFHLK